MDLFMIWAVAQTATLIAAIFVPMSWWLMLLPLLLLITSYFFISVFAWYGWRDRWQK